MLTDCENTQADYQELEFSNQTFACGVAAKLPQSIVVQQPAKPTKKPRVYLKWVVYELAPKDTDIVVFASNNQKDCQNVAALKKLANPDADFIVGQKKLTANEFSNFYNAGNPA